MSRPSGGTVTPRESSGAEATTARVRSALAGRTVPGSFGASPRSGDASRTRCVPASVEKLERLTVCPRRRLTDGPATAEEDDALVVHGVAPAPNPFTPAGFLRTLEDLSAPVRDFFARNVLPVTLVPIPTFLDEREMLRRRLAELEARLRGVEQSSANEVKELRVALSRAESALEGSKLERARAAVETMKHWRSHRAEVEQLREDQAALLASLGELKQARLEVATLRAERDAARAQAETLAGRVAALEAQLARKR